MGLGYRKVKCRVCSAEYICTPRRDYYLTTNDPLGGVCWDCLLKINGMGPQPEPLPGSPLGPIAKENSR